MGGEEQIVRARKKPATNGVGKSRNEGLDHGRFRKLISQKTGRLLCWPSDELQSE